MKRMSKHSSTLVTAAVGLTVVALAAPAAWAQSGSQSSSMKRGFVAQSALRTIFKKGAYRVSVVEVQRQPRPRAVTIRVKDATGRVVRKTKGRVTPKRALVLDVKITGKQRMQQLRAEIDFQVFGPQDPGPVISDETIDHLKQKSCPGTSCGCPTCTQSVGGRGVQYNCSGWRITAATDLAPPQ